MLIVRAPLDIMTAMMIADLIFLGPPPAPNWDPFLLLSAQFCPYSVDGGRCKCGLERVDGERYSI